MLPTILILLLFALLQAYAAVQGFTHGILYSRKGHEAFNWDEHTVFGLERITVGLILVLSLYTGVFIQFERVGYYAIFYVTLALATLLVFSFWHNGFYNLARKNIDKPKYRFMDDSERGDVWLHISPSGRITGLIVGWLILLFCCKALFISI